MILIIPQKQKPPSHRPELERKIVKAVALRGACNGGRKRDLNRIFVIAKFEDPDDVQVLPEYAIEFCKVAAISRHRHIAVNIEADRQWFPGFDGLQQLCKQT